MVEFNSLVSLAIDQTHVYFVDLRISSLFFLFFIFLLLKVRMCPWVLWRATFILLYIALCSFSILNKCSIKIRDFQLPGFLFLFLDKFAGMS